MNNRAFVLLACSASLFAQSESVATSGKTGAKYENTFIWRDPGNVALLDFVGGPGGRENIPVPPFVFSEDFPSATSPKIVVQDAKRRRYIVKWGPEVKAETFASRIAWAAGYHADATYYVPSGSIEALGAIGRAEKFIDRSNGNTFQDARFELMDDKVHFLPTSNWSFASNPFVGSRELDGLKVISMLVSNWDVKDARSTDGYNTALIEIKNPRGGMDLRYAIEDWGGSMGDWGRYGMRDKWNCDGFSGQSKDFVKGVDSKGNVRWGYSGRTAEIKEGISATDVKWLMQYLGRVTDSQIRTGLQASGANAEETACFVGALRSRLNQLQEVATGRTR